MLRPTFSVNPLSIPLPATQPCEEIVDESEEPFPSHEGPRVQKLHRRFLRARRAWRTSNLPLAAMRTDESPTFHPFPRLPVEIRLKIWALAQPKLTLVRDRPFQHEPDSEGSGRLNRRNLLYLGAQEKQLWDFSTMAKYNFLTTTTPLSEGGKNHVAHLPRMRDTHQLIHHARNQLPSLPRQQPQHKKWLRYAKGCCPPRPAAHPAGLRLVAPRPSLKLQSRSTTVVRRTELWHLVWGYAAPPAAVVPRYPRAEEKKKRKKGKEVDRKKRTVSLTVPGLLHVCKESRYMYLDDSLSVEDSSMRTKADVAREREIMANTLNHPVHKACYFSQMGAKMRCISRLSMIRYSVSQMLGFVGILGKRKLTLLHRYQHLVIGLVDFDHFPALEDMTVIMDEPTLLYYYRQGHPGLTGNVVLKIFRQRDLDLIRGRMGDTTDGDEINPTEDYNWRC
ncbi:hypothetical protein B7494_g3456 [Chlorociboria aeruginascens]|nr:hypothetical protein B7494_g3456 [Chlorociboria aeruginascens]